MVGCVEWMEIVVDGVKTWAHAFVIEDAPYDLLLGRPWQKAVKLEKLEVDGGVDVVVHNPKALEESVRVKTRARGERGLSYMYRVVEDKKARAEEERQQMKEMFEGLTKVDEMIKSGSMILPDRLLSETHVFDTENHVLVYRRVADKKKMVPAELPDHFKVRRYRPEVDPLTTLPPLSMHPTGLVLREADG
ncbi:hypothetical protein CC2G_013544 [Coprinopsis cinerea AmutBmut pab1-1]|nr:hypothetical protein CC2G_013544 [Coprinopsis cinerea AmutBmut pab1-1]